jgi:hypothetical protein
MTPVFPVFRQMQVGHGVFHGLAGDLTRFEGTPVSYTLGMDSVRFGRALGIGARAAAKTLVTAVDAATSPNPSAKPSGATQASSRPATGARPQTSNVVEQVTRAASQMKQTSESLNRGGKQFGQSVWSPFVRLSGVLWLEFTGVFFGIFALFAANGAWKMRGDLRETALNHEGHVHFLMAAVMALLFTYFCVSSFLRARRRERGTR